MSVKELIRESLASRPLNEAPRELQPEAFELLEHLLEMLSKDIDESLSGNRSNVGESSEHLPSIIDIYLESTQEEEFGSVDITIESDRRALCLYIAGRVIDAMRKETWSGSYYSMLNSIYRHDKVLRKMWMRYLPPVPLLDLKAKPEGRELTFSPMKVPSVSAVIDRAMADCSFDTDALLAIHNAALWVTTVASKLTEPQQLTMLEFIEVDGDHTNPLCDLYTRVVAVIVKRCIEIAELSHQSFDSSKNGPKVVSKITYMIVVNACNSNPYWSDLDFYLHRERYSEPEPQDVEPPMLSLPIGNDSLPYHSASTKAEFFNFDRYRTPSKIDIEIGRAKADEFFAIQYGTIDHDSEDVEDSGEVNYRSFGNTGDEGDPNPIHLLQR